MLYQSPDLRVFGMITYTIVMKVSSRSMYICASCQLLISQSMDVSWQLLLELRKLYTSIPLHTPLIVICNYLPYWQLANVLFRNTLLCQKFLTITKSVHILYPSFPYIKHVHVFLLCASLFLVSWLNFGGELNWIKIDLYSITWLD